MNHWWTVTNELQWQSETQTRVQSFQRIPSDRSNTRRRNETCKCQETIPRHEPLTLPSTCLLTDLEYPVPLLQESSSIRQRLDLDSENCFSTYSITRGASLDMLGCNTVLNAKQVCKEETKAREEEV